MVRVKGKNTLVDHKSQPKVVRRNRQVTTDIERVSLFDYVIEALPVDDVSEEARCFSVVRLMASVSGSL